MRFITPVVYAALFGTAIYAALAQTTLPFASASADTADQTTLAYATPADGSSKPVRVGKRETCRQMVGAKNLGRRAARDQLQLCVAQARVECLQQAIDQKIRGPQRKAYVKSCVAA